MIDWFAACRSKEKAIEAIEEIKGESGNQDIHFIRLDLCDLDSVDGTWVGTFFLVDQSPRVREAVRTA